MVLQSIGCDTCNAVLVLVGTENTCNESTVTETVVEWVIVWLRLVRTSKGITDEIVTTGNLASLTETSTKGSSSVVDSRIYDTDLDTSTSVSGSVDLVDLDLGIGGETSEW